VVGLAFGVSGCGSSRGDRTVATIGNDTKVSQTTLNHWMNVVLGGDYSAALNKQAPIGLVSEPADHARCVSVARRIAPRVGDKPKLTSAQLLVKCHQLYTAIKEQALNYVISVLWSREEAKELGLHMPSEDEISGRLRDLANNIYKGPTEFRKVIAEQRRSLADVRFLIKRNLLEGEIAPRIKVQATKLGGSKRTYYKLILQNNAKWQAKTSCSPGYKAWECKQYGTTGEASAGEAKPPPAVILEYFDKGVA
jgi:hypothetical protein